MIIKSKKTKWVTLSLLTFLSQNFPLSIWFNTVLWLPCMLIFANVLGTPTQTCVFVFVFCVFVFVINFLCLLIIIIIFFYALSFSCFGHCTARMTYEDCHHLQISYVNVSYVCDDFKPLIWFFRMWGRGWCG